LYGFYLPKLAQQLPHLVLADWELFGKPFDQGSEPRHEFEPEAVRGRQLIEAYKELYGPHEFDDVPDEELTEEHVEKIYKRMMEKVRTNPVLAELFEELSKIMKKALDEK